MSDKTTQYSVKAGAPAGNLNAAGQPVQATCSVRTGTVQATWSDAAREASARARASEHRDALGSIGVKVGELGEFEHEGQKLPGFKVHAQSISGVSDKHRQEVKEHHRLFRADGAMVVKHADGTAKATDASATRVGTVTAAGGAYAAGHEFHGNQYKQGEALGAVHPTLLQYAVQESFKKTSAESAAKSVAKKFHGSENMFMGEGKINVTHEQLAHALYKNGAEEAERTSKLVKPGMEHMALAGTAQLLKLNPDRLRHYTNERMGEASPFKGTAKANQSMKDNSNIVRCYAAVAQEISIKSEPWSSERAVKFCWAPGGVHTITAGFSGPSTKGRDCALTLTVDVVPERDAKVCQSSMDAIKAAKPDQEPYGCFEHDEKQASVWASSFSAGADPVYGRPSVLLEGRPSGSGAKAVNDRDWRRWSPSFGTDADYDKCQCTNCQSMVAACECAKPALTFPDGVRGSQSNPARITGVAFVLGTLTNRPAFSAMPPVKATAAVEDGHSVVPPVVSKYPFVPGASALHPNAPR